MAETVTGIVIEASVEDEAAKKVEELADAIGKLSEKAGISVEELEKFMAAEQAAKTGADEAAPAIQAVADALGSAVDGAPSATESMGSVAGSISSAG